MNKTNIIAEIGNTHEGSVGLAKQFIKVAAACGVDAVKFQTHMFEAESLPNAPNPKYFTDETRKQYFERTAFNFEQYQVLKQYAEQECGVEFLSSPFSIEAVDFLLKLGLKTLKIPSGEVSNIPMLEYIAKSGCKVLLSSGMSSWAELDEAVNIFKPNNELIVLQCTSEYPCAPENAGIGTMQQIKSRYGCQVGFSDHTLGIGVPIAAVVSGAVVVEKHFTLSKMMYGSDAKNSTEPEEFKQLVEGIRAAEKSIYSVVDKDAKVESLRDMKVTFEKSIVAAEHLPEGTIIQEKHLCYKKPGNGIPAKKYRDIIGKKVIQQVEKNQLLSLEHFA
ncbi:MAG: legionaminic acid synthase [Bacteroidota bacterium]|jgi:N,N'-diacetyllegionaminate synthase